MGQLICMLTLGTEVGDKSMLPKSTNGSKISQLNDQSARKLLASCLKQTNKKVGSFSCLILDQTFP